MVVRWVVISALCGCNLALNAVRPSSEPEPPADPEPPPEDSDSAPVVEPGGLLISEVIDGEDDLKFVELFNGTDQDLDLTGYRLRRYSNGQGYPTEPSLSLDPFRIPAGEAFVICGSLERFVAAFGEQPDHAAPETVLGNGNDVYELSLASQDPAEVIDVFGEIGVDGFGTDWDYGNKSAQRRQDVVSGGADFRSSEWDIALWSRATPGER